MLLTGQTILSRVVGVLIKILLGRMSLKSGFLAQMSLFLTLGMVLITTGFFPCAQASISSSNDQDKNYWDKIYCSSFAANGFIQEQREMELGNLKSDEIFYYVPRQVILNISSTQKDSCEMRLSHLFSTIAVQENRAKNIFTFLDPVEFPLNCGAPEAYSGFKIFLSSVVPGITSTHRRFLIALRDDKTWKHWGDQSTSASFDRSMSEAAPKLRDFILQARSYQRVHFMLMHRSQVELTLDDEVNTIRRSENLTEEEKEEKIGNLLFSTPCRLHVAKQEGDENDALRNFSKTSVLFVSVSFIILMVISLAWLVFYYVQRFRYAHAKDRLARRLFNAAKKALTKIPTRVLKQGDPELDTDCPVCIEPYSCSDVIRILPCKHVFHKTCVDPWLLEHRTCPMCKGDILKAFGYKFAQIEDSANGAGYDDGRVSVGGQSTDEQGSSSSVGGSYAAYPFPGNVTDSDIHDPFFPSPAPSPSLVQQVMHPSSAAGFSIIPLTVHSNSISRPSSSQTQTGKPVGSATRSLAEVAGASDSSSEINGESPSGPLGSFKQHHSAEIHHAPHHGCETSSSPTDSHGHSASNESSSSDSDSSFIGAQNRAAAAPLLTDSARSTGDQQLFQPRPSTAPVQKEPGQFQTRSRSAGNGPMSPPKKKHKSARLRRQQSTGAPNSGGTVVPVVKSAGGGGVKSKKDAVSSVSGPSGSRRESSKGSKGRFSAKRPTTQVAKSSVVIGTVSDLGSLESI